MPLVLFDGLIGDGADKLHFVVRQEITPDRENRPFTLVMDGEAWPIGVYRAAVIADKAKMLQYRLENTPERTGPIYQHRFDITDDATRIFELGIDPPAGVYLSWGDGERFKRAVCAQHGYPILNAILAMGEAVRNLRRARAA